MTCEQNHSAPSSGRTLSPHSREALLATVGLGSHPGRNATQKGTCLIHTKKEMKAWDPISVSLWVVLWVWFRGSD